MGNRSRHRYRVVAVSLYEADAQEADRCTEVLRRVGWPKANRSLVVREALRLLEEVLAGKDDERVFRYFVERYARRLGGGPSKAPREDVAVASTLPTADVDERVDVPAESSRRRH